MHATRVISVGALLLAAVAWGCDEPGADGGAAGVSGSGAGGESGTSAGAGAGSGASGTGAGRAASGSGAGTGAAGGGLGPTSSIRVVNLVPDVTFDAWGPGLDGKPVRLAENLEYETASDYFEVPVNEFSQEPIFILWRSGDAPDPALSFSMRLENTHERMRVQARELEGPGERATVIIEPVEPFDENPTAPLQFEQLDETELMRGDATKLNLHVSYHLFGIGGGIVNSFAIEGESCLHDGSTSVTQAFSVPAGESTLAIYDRQTGAGCSETDPLATLPIAGDAGDNLLITLYREGNDIKMFSAPLE